LQEVDVWEKDGNLKLLQDRGRNLVVRLKDVEELHQRALVVYRDLLDLSHSRSTRCSFRADIDEKFDDILVVDLPHVFESSLTSSSEKFVAEKVLGEPSSEDLGLSIFMMPEEEEGAIACTAETSTPGEVGPEKSNPIARSIFLETRRINSTAYQDSSYAKGICSDDEKARRSLPADEGYFKKDSKASSSDGYASRSSTVLGSFPWRNLKDPAEWKMKDPIEWKIDKTTYMVKCINDLRTNHKVLIEGAFRKRCRAHKWRNYYGFLLATGVLLYFRKEIFKKVVDIRNSIIIQPRSKQFRLCIEGVVVESRECNWLMEFDRKDHLAIWKDHMALLSRGLKIEIDTLL